jgi:hypothetical protein
MSDLTPRDRIRLTLATIDAKLDESRRSRHREFELGVEGLAAVARHRYPTAARLNYENRGDGDGRDDYIITDIRDRNGNVLWAYAYGEYGDKFATLLETYADLLKYGSDSDTCLVKGGAGGWPVLVLTAG